MTEIINFNKMRKAKRKQEQTAQAQQNRILYGISTKARKLQGDTQEKAQKNLDGKRLQSDETNKGG